MPTVHLRLTGSDDIVRLLIDEISGLEGVDSAEEIADLMPHMDDDDSSSAGLSDDRSPGYHSIEVEVSNDTVARRVRELARTESERRGAVLEIVDEI
ncbi:MAG: hypothetical protein ABIR16_04820 [Dokdonella sp.]